MDTQQSFPTHIYQELGRSHRGGDGGSDRAQGSKRRQRHQPERAGCGSASSASAAGRRRTSIRPSSCRTKRQSRDRHRVRRVQSLSRRSRSKRSTAAPSTSPSKPATTATFINDKSIDAVVIATPDHWHARQTIDALKAGKHVYCEKPMTHSVDEALAVHKAWKDSGQVMQVGVQSTALPVWQDARKRICDGQLGKVLMYQTEFFRNSDLGQWRYYELAERHDAQEHRLENVPRHRVFARAGHAVRPRPSSPSGAATGISAPACSPTCSCTARRRC